MLGCSGVAQLNRINPGPCCIAAKEQSSCPKGTEPREFECTVPIEAEALKAHHHALIFGHKELSDFRDIGSIHGEQLLDYAFHLGAR